MQNPWHTAQPDHRIAFTDGRIFPVIAWRQHTHPNGQNVIEPLLCVPGYIDLRTVEETGEFYRHLPPGTPNPEAGPARGIDEVGNAIQTVIDYFTALDHQAEFKRAVKPMGDPWKPLGPLLDEV